MLIQNSINFKAHYQVNFTHDIALTMSRTLQGLSAHFV